jgi:hypothetical protein
MPQSSEAKHDFLTVCREHYNGNNRQLKLIDDFDKNDIPSDAVRWYTSDTFLYRLLNKAFRSENIDILFQFRFFICDLYSQLTKAHNELIDFYMDECSGDIESTQWDVRRGQKMSTNEFERIKKT